MFGAEYVILVVVLVIPPVLFAWWMVFRALRAYRKRMCKRQGRITVGLFHPYCNAGGGGERVLWCAIRSLQTRYPHVDCIVYTGDIDARPVEILKRASDRMGVEPIREVEFVYLYTRGWVEASRWPYFTLIGQSLGSLILGWEALRQFVPDVYIDTMGYAFTLPLFKYFGGSRVAAYIHYPTISTDMLARVEKNEAAFNNKGLIARNPYLSRFKLIYYKIFAWIYKQALRRGEVLMTNSSWTLHHIKQITCRNDVSIVYPPCDVTQFIQIPYNESKSKHIVSIGQFRPEKDHPLQVRSFHKFYSSLSEHERSEYKLVMIGGCRNEDDEQRVENLRALTEELNISSAVEFLLNVDFNTVKQRLSQSTVGIHTMYNEHFGIGVVEIMAAGTIVLAHKSGGPLMDIVTIEEPRRTGYLANDIDSYCECIKTIFNLKSTQQKQIIDEARKSVSRFNEETFNNRFLTDVKKLILS